MAVIPANNPEWRPTAPARDLPWENIWWVDEGGNRWREGREPGNPPRGANDPNFEPGGQFYDESRPGNGRPENPGRPDNPGQGSGRDQGGNQPQSNKNVRGSGNA